MTTFIRTVKKGELNTYTVSEQGYWDYTDNITINEDTNIDITLKEYPGVLSSYKVNTYGAPSFELDNCTLPNNKAYSTKKYAIDKIGINHVLVEDLYHNFKIRGNNTVDKITGLMTGITNTDNIGKNFNPQTENWSITLELQTPTTISTKTSIFGAYDTTYTMPELYLNADGTLGLCLSSNGASWDIADNVMSTTSLVSSTKYKIVVAYNASAYTVKVTPLSDYFSSEETTYIELASSTPIFSTENSYLNIGYSVGNNCWKGFIYLNNSSITIGSETLHFFTGFINSAPGILESSISSASNSTLNIFVKRSDNSLLLDNKMQTKDYMWVGTKTFAEYSYYHLTLGTLYANFKVQGELIPTNTEIHVGPFSANNLIYGINTNLNWNNTFTAYLTFETGDDITSLQSIFSNATNGSIGIHNGKWKALTTNTVYGQDVLPNTQYDIKLSQDIYNLYLYTRVSGTSTWELQLTVDKQYLPQDTFYIGNNGHNEPFLGKIHLKTVKIEAEETSWIACDEQSKASTM